MIALMVISFYTSRELLAILGIENYGLYSVVGSVAATFSALKSLFSEAVQRYLNNQKGLGSIEGQRAVFNIGLIIHIVLAIVFIVVVEIVGLWLLYNKLNIPSEMFNTALIVLQLTILFTAISIISIPYDAVIIANEKMGVFAALTVIDGLFRLLVVVAILPIIKGDRLVVYGAFLLLIPISSLIFQYLFCRRFSECRYSLKFDRSFFKELASLSVWNFMGNICFSLVHEGINMLLNIFGGLTLNTARAISYKVKTLSSQITYNTIVAVRPRIMQGAAIDSKDGLFNNIFTLSRISFFLMLIPIIPLMAYCYQLLDIWLIDVPDYSSSFSRLVMIGVLVRSLHEPLNMLYMSVAKIKRMMIIEALVMLSFFGLIFIALKIGLDLWIAFVILDIMEVVIVLSLIINAKYELGVSVKTYFYTVLYPTFSLSVLLAIICYLCYRFLEPHTTWQTLAYSAFLVCLTAIVLYFFLDSKEKIIFKRLILKK